MPVLSHTLLVIVVGFCAARGMAGEPREHWAFSPLRAQVAPQVRGADWPVNEIDRFVLAKLEAAGLTPSLRADKRTLIRRAYFDLMGLPPTYEQVQAFIADSSPGAFERVIDSLLASPGYGERWGRYWLDLARYSDTKGYVYGNREERFFVHAHAYRDWVIRAFNEDMPYDRFLMLQIAADQIEEAQPRPSGALAAMGFLTVGRRFLGVIPDIIDDRIDVLTRATQGLTVSCARCHDHKFDPIPTADYYSLYGVFTASTEKIVPLVSQPPRTAVYEAFEKELHARKAKLHETFHAKREELAQRLRAKAGDYLATVPEADQLPTDDFYEIRQPDDLIPTCVRHWQSYLHGRSKQFDPIFEPWHALAKLGPGEVSAKASEILARLLADTAQPLNRHVAQAFTGASPAMMRDVAAIYGKLLSDAEQVWKTAREQEPSIEALPDADQEALRLVLYGEDSPTTVPDGSIHEVEWFFDEKTRVEIDSLNAEVERWLINGPGAPPHAVIFEDRESQPNPRVFLRGNPAIRGPEVPRQYLELIEGHARAPFTVGSGRLELARAIADRENPLTARVMVNRIWLHHFGRGLVATPSDFGTRADPPSHPELLDYLALRFMDEGWSIKKLHKLIMLSATYQQSSGDRSDHFAGDPENLLLWRANPRRLDFESIRDSMLTATGELDTTMGGRPVNLFADVGPRQTIWGTIDPSPAGRAERRTIYGLVDRQFLPAVFRAFDFANPDLHSPQRPTTTVPQQALFLMNSPFMMTRARALAGRADVVAISNLEQRIQKLYQLVYQRPAEPRQIEAARRLVEAIEADPPARAPSLTVEQTAWRYGYGEFDEATQRTKSFAELPAFIKDAWQGGTAWPDGKLGWVQLTATGGHTGNDLKHAAIRRWIAPRDAIVTISGTLKHEHAISDGVRFRLVSSREGLIGQWQLRNQSADAIVRNIVVQAGDTIDFIVDLRAELNSDFFTWAPTIEASDGEPKRWNATEEFAGGPPPPPLNAWEQYAQVLLLSNEFLFID